MVSAFSPTPKSSPLLLAGGSALFQHAGTPNPREHETLWGFCGIGRGGEPRSPGEAPPALHTQPGSAGPRARHPPPDLPLTRSLSSHKPLQHPNAVSPFKAFLSPLRGLRGGSEVSGRLHFFLFFHHYPSLLSLEIFLMPSQY